MDSNAVSTIANAWGGGMKSVEVYVTPLLAHPNHLKSRFRKPRTAQMLNITVEVDTSEHYWFPIKGDCEAFANLPLWYPHYESAPNPSFSDFEPFGVWTQPNMR